MYKNATNSANRNSDISDLQPSCCRISTCWGKRRCSCGLANIFDFLNVTNNWSFLMICPVLYNHQQNCWFCIVSSIWRFPIHGGTPVIIHFNRIFHYKPSSYCGSVMTMESSLSDQVMFHPGPWLQRYCRDSTSAPRTWRLGCTNKGRVSNM